MQIDGTMLFAIISFLIFLLIIKFIVLKPISKAIENRDNFYFKNSKMEQDSIQKSKTLLEQKQQLLDASRDEASNILKEASLASKLENEAQINQAKTLAKDEMEKNRANLEQESKTAKHEIKSQIKDIVKSIVSKILNEDIEIELNDSEIDKYLKI